MKDLLKSKAQLIEELESMRSHVADLQTQASDTPTGVTDQNKIVAAAIRESLDD